MHRGVFFAAEDTEMCKTDLFSRVGKVGTCGLYSAGLWETGRECCGLWSREGWHWAVWSGRLVTGFCQMVVVMMGMLLRWLASEKRSQEWAWRLEWLSLQPPLPPLNSRIHDGHCWAERLERRVRPEPGGLCVAGGTMSVFFLQLLRFSKQMNDGIRTLV